MAGETTSRKNDLNGNKGKKSKSEMINSALDVYLKSKNFTSADKFKKSDITLSQSSGEFVLNRFIEEDTSRGNSFLYSNVLCLTNHYSVVEQTFEKFVQFVENQPQAIKEELKLLFGPIISHIYVELLKGREWKPACDFLRNHAKLVAPVENLNAPLPNKINGCSVSSNFHDTNDSNNSNNTSSSPYPTATTQILFVNESTGNETRDFFKEIIQTLSTCLRYETLQNFESLILFRSSKYEFKISLDAITALRKFLENQGHVIILNIIRTWIHFEIRDFEDNTERNNASGPEHDINVNCEYFDMSKIKVEASAGSSASTKEQRKIPINMDILRLQSTLNKFKNLDNPLGIIKIFDQERGLSSAAIDSKKCHIVAGFNNSSVKLWQLSRHILSGRNLYEKIQNRLCDWSITNRSDNEYIEDIESVLSKEKEEFYAKKCEGNSFDDTGGVLLYGHTRGITDCMFSEKFPLLFTTSKDCTMRVWEAKNYQCKSIYSGHNYPVWCVGESPVGLYVATGSRDKTARLWSIDREFPLKTYVGHTQDIECLAFHPNGNYLATGSCDSTVRLWSVTSGELSRVLTGNRFGILCVAFSPDGKYLAAADEESKLRIYDLAASSQIGELKGNSPTINHIIWSSSGNKIASSSTDGSVCMWDVTKINSNEQISIPSTMKMNSGCSRGIKVFFSANNTITLIGTSNNC